jgi:hypothetical protein
MALDLLCRRLPHVHHRQPVAVVALDLPALHGRVRMGVIIGDALYMPSCRPVAIGQLAQ